MDSSKYRKHKRVLYLNDLDACWAVFFNAMEIKHKYRCRSVKLMQNICVTPTFYLNELKSWVFVMPSNPRPIFQRELIQAFCKETKERVLVVTGDPMAPIDNLIDGARFPEPPSLADSYTMFLPDGEDYPYFFCTCPVCGKLGIEYNGRGERVCGSAEDESGHGGSAGHKNHTYASAPVLKAMRISRRWLHSVRQSKDETPYNELIHNGIIGEKRIRLNGAYLNSFLNFDGEYLINLLASEDDIANIKSSINNIQNESWWAIADEYCASFSKICKGNKLYCVRLTKFLEKQIVNSNKKAVPESVLSDGGVWVDTILEVKLGLTPTKNAACEIHVIGLQIAHTPRFYQ